MIKRRRFLLGGLGVAVVAGLGVWGGYFATDSEIVAGVRRRLSFLRLDDAGLHSFAKDYIATMLAKRPSWYRWKVHFHALFSRPSSAKWGISSDTRSRRERFEDYLATIYLLSSDFFVTGADESRTVNYVNLYDPIRACGNPFARAPIGGETPT